MSGTKINLHLNDIMAHQLRAMKITWTKTQKVKPVLVNELKHEYTENKAVLGKQYFQCRLRKTNNCLATAVVKVEHEQSHCMFCLLSLMCFAFKLFS